MTQKNALFSGAAMGLLLAVVINAGAHAAARGDGVSHERMLEAQLKALQDEVASLQQVVTQLQATQQAQSPAAEAARRQETQAAVQAALQKASAAQDAVLRIPSMVRTEVVAAKPKTDKLYYQGVSLTIGGFAEGASIYRSHDETADISSNFSRIPFDNDRAGHTSETRFTARQSRYSALVKGDLNPDTHAIFYGEFDFQGGAQTANSNQSNSYNPRIRNLYGEADWDKWGWHILAGQNWSLATMNSRGISPRNELTPPQIDAQYVPGFAWARQPQLRVTKDFNKEVWLAVSLENPQTTFGNVTTATGVTLTNVQTPTNGFFNGASFSLNKYPDLIGKIALEKKLGGRNLHLEALGVARSFTSRVSIAPTASNQAGLLGYAAGDMTKNSTGGGFGGGVTFEAVPKRLDVQASILSGKGIGRYGSAGLPDATAAPDGELRPISETMFMAGATLHANPMLDIYLFGGEERQKPEVFASAAIPGGPAFGHGSLAGSSSAGCMVEGGSCSAVTKAISQVTAGFWQKLYQGPLGRLQFGIQYSHTNREVFADAKGFAPTAHENMVFTSFRYYPFQSF